MSINEAGDDWILVEHFAHGGLLMLERNSLRFKNCDQLPALSRSGYYCNLVGGKLALYRTHSGNLGVVYDGSACELVSGTTFQRYDSAFLNRVLICFEGKPVLSIRLFAPIELLLLPVRLLRYGVLPEEDGAFDLIDEIQRCIDNRGVSSLPNLQPTKAW